MANILEDIDYGGWGILANKRGAFNENNARKDNYGKYEKKKGTKNVESDGER